MKRRGATNQKELQRKRRVTKPEAPSEDLLVAMALSRSEMEQEAVPAVLRLGNAFSERIRLGAGRRIPAGGGSPRCWPKVTAAGPRDPLLLFTSRKEEPQEEGACFPSPIVSPGPGDHGEADGG